MDREVNGEFECRRRGVISRRSNPQQIDDIAIIACSGVDSPAAVSPPPWVACSLRYVDTGFMRRARPSRSKRCSLLTATTTVHAADRYFAALAGVTEPEAKQNIGELFIRVFEDGGQGRCEVP